MNNKIKKELKIERNDSWIYIVLLSALSILISSTRKYSFHILSANIEYSALLIPWIYFIIIKKYKYKKSIISLLITVINVALYIMFLSFALNKKVEQIQIIKEIVPLLISGLVNIFIYHYLLVNTKKNKILIFLNYLFSVIIYNLLYVIFTIKRASIVNYWEIYLITITIEFIIFIPLTIITTKK